VSDAIPPIVIVVSVTPRTVELPDDPVLVLPPLELELQAALAARTASTAVAAAPVRTDMNMFLASQASLNE
jgi:hypothetical protein